MFGDTIQKLLEVIFVDFFFKKYILYFGVLFVASGKRSYFSKVTLHYQELFMLRKITSATDKNNIRSCAY